MKQPVAFGPTVTVAANDKVEPGSYNIQISDVLKNSLIIRVSVVLVRIVRSLAAPF